MDNYKDIAAKENKLNEKKILVDDTIKEGKLSKYEIIKKMIDGLVNEIEDLKKLLFTDLAVTNDSKEKAEKISKIAFRTFVPESEESRAKGAGGGDAND